MKIAIVTGASSGMGRQFVLQLSDYVQVDEIWVIARREGALEALKNEVSVPIRPLPLDLCEESAFDAISALLGLCAVVVVSTGTLRIFLLVVAVAVALVISRYIGNTVSHSDDHKSQ